jgi:hypothetical protein
VTTLTINASYPATDGSVPESIEIRYEGEMPLVVDLLAVIEALGNLPARRYAQEASSHAED